MPTWEEVKKLCDNPEVPPDQKKALLEAYYTTEMDKDFTGTHNDELEKYLDDYDVSYGDGFGQSLSNAMPWSDSSEDRLNNAYDIAKKSGDAGQKKIDDHNNAKKSGQNTLDQSEQRAADGGAGVGNSNFLLDAGAPGLKYFENFLPVYVEAKKVIGVGASNVPTDFNAVKTLYEEQRDIDFHKIDEDIKEMRQVSTDLRTQQADSEKSMSKLWSTWDGKAADNSRAFVADFSKKAAAVADGINHIADATRAACHTVSQLVNDKANAVLNGVGSPFDIAGKTPPQIREIVQAATSDDEGVLRRAAGHVGIQINDEACDEDRWKEQVRIGARDWLQGTFHNDVSQKWTNFEKLCKDTKKAVDDAWNALGAEIDKINTKPFEPAKEETPAEKPGGGGKNQNPGGGGGGGGGGPTGGGGGGGGGMPEIPKPENPLDKNGDGKPDLPGDTDGDGKIDDLDGDGKPDNQQQLPKPEENLETVTVKAGDNTIKVTEPDSNGHVKMTIDTPKGEPKTYDLDFSKNPEAAKALMGQNGAQAITAMANQLTGTPTQGSQAPGAPAPTGGTPTPGGGAPGGTGMGAPGSESNPIPVEVGADGKIHIEQDGVNFTAEVNTQTGEINLTADNGDGTPDQIGVSFGEDENPAAGTDPAGVGGGGSGGMTGDLRLDQPLNIPDQDFPQPVDGAYQTMPAPAPGEFQPMPAPAQGEFHTMPAQSEFQPMPAPAQGEFHTMPAQGEQVWSPPGSAGPPVGPNYIQDNGIMPNVGEPRIVAAPDGTVASGVSFTGGGSSGGESVLGGSSPADSAWSTPSQGDNGGAFNTNASEAGQAGSANLPSMQDAHGQPTSGPAAGGMMGGGMMGGGMMGGAGAGGQQGGDTERGASQWRTTGSLFDEDNSNPLSSAQGVLSGDDGNRGGQW
ncbi:hypothetical protein GCM10022267_58270 [Lentzea roselyniae]|uniref:WXG100 family type VII secretion target n=1 Tax=Lentzea roselyniae TaxID=531940 RepID=A0ABP7BNC7_9PSEU